MSTTAPRQMKLFNLAWKTGSHVAGWRHPNAAADGLHSLAYYQELARISERGKFDAIFFADTVGFHRTRGRDAFSRSDQVTLEPLTLLGALAASTTRLGLVATASTTYNHAYTLARQFASIDHLSGGRVGWNIVTSSAENEAHNFGLDQNLSHAERYERATEFVEIVTALWDSFEDDAMVVDKAAGRYFDPDKLHGLGHRGKFYNVEGPLNIGRPPQGHPVLVQAGASEAGRRFSAQFAEAIFTSHPVIESARTFYGEMKALVTEFGRNPDHLKILPSVKPIVGSTEAEARAIEAELRELIHPDLALSMLESFIGGFDLSSFPIDGPLPPLPPTENARSTQMRVIEWAERDNLTIRQLAARVAAQRTGSFVVGTPEQIADSLELWFNGGAADGFAIGAAYLPGGLEVFVDEVVPVLQKRGLFRREYEGSTLRENLGLPRPPNYFTEHPDRHVEPEIW